ncbi:multidrug transporter [Paenibacillus yonginensis]|uniref:Multidrug transporter n=1 Tax=Paenibacillus yonginensis TaxID=1462996 RepID=A0A1B1N568_9BACL|nr:DMT family transporter [Paenibacillus yonginensis]ANS76552.1 multidrug transporter [Paenibacillus yonginensis]
MNRSLYFALILLSLIWGGSFLFVKILLDDYGPWGVAFMRSSFGLVVIVGIMLVTRRPFGFKNIRWLPMAAISLINTAVPWALIGFSETRLTSGMASILNATTPLWTLVIGVVLFQAATTRRQWLGMVIALVGLVILVGLRPGTLTSVDPVGLTGMLGATLCYGFGTQLTKRYLPGLTLYQTTFGTLVSAMLGSGVMAFSTEQVSFAHLASLPVLGAVIGLGVFGSGLAYVLFYFMVQKGSPEFATMVTYLVPVTALVWGFTLLDETVSWNMLAGLCFILGGVYLAGSKGRKKTPGREQEITAV